MDHNSVNAEMEIKVEPGMPQTLEVDPEGATSASYLKLDSDSNILDGGESDGNVCTEGIIITDQLELVMKEEPADQDDEIVVTNAARDSSFQSQLTFKSESNSSVDGTLDAEHLFHPTTSMRKALKGSSGPGSQPSTPSYSKMSEANLFNEHLIDLVKSNEAIWNPEHRDHRRSSHLDVLWSDIGVQLNKDPAVCKKRWRSLRDRFTRESNRMKGITGQAASTSCGWALFNLLEFLRPTSTRRPAISNYKPGTLLNLTNLELDGDFLNEQIIHYEDTCVDRGSPIITMSAPNDALAEVRDMQPPGQNSGRSIDDADESTGVPTTKRQRIVEINDEISPSTSSKSRAYKRKQSDFPPQSDSCTNEEAILRHVNQQTPTTQFLSADELWFLAIGKEVKDLPKKRRIHVKKATMKALYEDIEYEEEE
uniref:Transcription factor Adf-1 n=1 Tax=Lygus hesperus TaxID=30085 RepID=A0A0A9ZE30_LYGHE